MRKVFLSILSVSLLALLTACGDSHHSIPIPDNPSGGNDAGFSNASLSGTYVFRVHGLTGGIRNEMFVAAGAFNADGDGTISGGTRDTVNDNGHRTLQETIADTSSYFINSDGRGQIVLDGSSGRAVYRIVLESPQRGSLFQVGTTSSTVVTDAVGTIELQSGTPASPAGAFIFRLDGEDNVRAAYGAIGRITFTGSSFSGIADEHDGSGITALNLSASGDISLSDTRGTATLTTTLATHHFVVYFVSPFRLELISTDTNFLLSGEAEAQQSFAASTSEFTADAPQQVFSLSGFDSSGPRVEMGRFTLSSNGSLVNGVADISTASGLFSGVSLNGSTFTVGANGRWTANLINSSGAPSPALVGWQVSPERSVVLITNRGTILETGTMLGQTLGLNTASLSGDFAETLAGFNTSSFANVELTANLRLNGSGALSGTFDAQTDDSGLQLDAATTGSYAVDPSLGRTTTGIIEGLPVVMYTVDPQTAFFLPAQAGRIYQGELNKQQP